LDPKNSVPKIKCMKEPEMLQPDAFREHTMQQNASSVPDPAFRQGRGPGDRGKGKGGVEDTRREEVEGEGSWNRAADWLRSALDSLILAVSILK